MNSKLRANLAITVSIGPLRIGRKTFISHRLSWSSELLAGMVSGEVRSPLISEPGCGAQVEPKSMFSMGKVRKCWREHLGLRSDEELYKILDGLHIKDNNYDLEYLRKQMSLNFHFAVAWRMVCGETLRLYRSGKRCAATRTRCARTP